MRPYTFFRTLWNTITSPKYYIDILNVKFRFSLRFLLVSYALLAAVSGLLFALFDAPTVQQKIDQSFQKASSDFPQDYSIEWNGLRIVPTSTAAATTTYALPLPTFRELDQAPPLLLQINPAVKSVADIATYSQQSSFFFVGDHELFMNQLGGQWNTTPLTDILPTTSFVINKETVTQQLPELKQVVDSYLHLIPMLLPLVFFFLTLPLRFISVFLDTLLIYLIVRMTAIPINFKKTVQLSMHVMVVSEIISLLTASFSRDLPMFTLTFWIYTIIVYWQLRHVKALPLSSALDRPEKDL